MTKKIGVGLVLVVIACAGCVVVWHKFMFPFGHRSYTLRHMYAALETYAADHFGKFPDSEKGPYAALQKLYPDYCLGGELAGVSGQVGKVEAVLRQGVPLNQTLTSWIYVTGLAQADNGNLAILWESKPGLYANGRRNFSGGHAVLLINGTVTNVPAGRWAAFLNQQEQLRKSVLSQRPPIIDGVTP